MFVFSSGVNMPAERVARSASSRRPPKTLVMKSCVARRTIASWERVAAYTWARPVSSRVTRPLRSRLCITESTVV